MVRSDNKRLSKGLLATFIMLLILPLINTCILFEPDPLLLVQTDPVTGEIFSSCNVSGTIVHVGEEAISQHGFCWSTQNNPTVENGGKIDLGSRDKVGIFSGLIVSLDLNTTYYLRAYATDNRGTAYGEAISFTTLEPSSASLTTAYVTDITQYSATCGGTISDDGGDAVTARGICWSTSSGPTITDNITSDGSGLGSYESNISGLACGTTYYVRAYATNAAGTGYGQQVSFTTLSCTVELPSVITINITNVTDTSAQSGGDITDDGGASITARGVCWSTQQNPTLSDSHTTDGSGSGAFASTISGLTPNTAYYIKAYATNSQGVGYGDQLNFTTLTSVETVTDYDGNVYQTVEIGSQTWMDENLKVTHYSDGTAFPLVESEAAWDALTATDNAYCWYNNSSSNGNTFGALYTWSAAMNGSESSDTNPSGVQGVCPSGWHLPGDAEWKQLEYYLGMSGQQVEEEGWRGTDEGGKLKEKGNTHWLFPNAGATNETGFSALPGGDRYSDGTFNDIGLYAIFWSATEYDSQNSWRRVLSAENSQIYRTTSRKRSGFSVRCIKD